MRTPKWFRFSLRTLVLFVLLCGSGMGLWWRWEPWVPEMPVHGTPISPGAAGFSFDAPDGRRMLRTRAEASGLWIWDKRQDRFLCSFRVVNELQLSYCKGFLDDNALVFDVLDVATNTYRRTVWHRRRPEWWWGVFWLWEFWLTAVLAGGFVFSLWRDRRELRMMPAGGTPA